jgi:DNA-binding SARP family transcriptional activator
VAQQRPTAKTARPGSRAVSDGATEVVRVKLLGCFSVSVGDRVIEQDEWRLRKAAALVKLLALAPSHRLHREQIIDLLWPDSGRGAASNNLRKTLHAARRTLDQARGSDYLASQDESLVLCPGGDLWVDVDAFEDSAAAARRSKDPAAYRAALDLHAGELLPEDRYEEWAEGRRSELRQLYLALVIELASIYEEREEYAQAIEVLGKVTSEEPTLEDAHASLMRLLALSGRPGRALAQYERLRDALQKGIGTPPTEATRRLRDEIAAGRLLSTSPSDPAHPVSSDASKHNLPAPMSSFVGREREMVEVKRALAMTRLLTLTGAGGSGKTRLSLEVARDLVGSYTDGVWLAELAPLSDDGPVTQEVANVLEVQERPGERLTDTLVEALAAKEMLLVIDNCEHVVEEAARLVDKLLSSCPHLKVLATSREASSLPAGRDEWRDYRRCPHTLRGGETLRRSRPTKAARLRSDPGERWGGGASVPQAGGDTAGHRARHGEDGGPCGRASRPEARSVPRRAQGHQPERRTQTADPESYSGLEPRSPLGGGAGML